ncbi:MAG: tetratricopeptide repeat protein [Spirochaetota bacterium]
MKYFSRIFFLFFLIACAAVSPAAEKTAVSYNTAGQEFLGKGEYFKAMIQFRSALRQNPSYKEPLLGMAHASLAVEAWRDAYDFYARVLKFDADNIEAMTGIGFAYIGLASYDRALEQFTSVLKKSENSIEAHYGTAYLYYIMNRNLWAKRKIDSIMKMNPFHYETLLLAADIKRDEGRFEEADDFIQRAIDQKTDFPEGYIRHAVLLNTRYLKTGDSGYLSDAKEQLEKALAIQPDNVKALSCLGYLHINENSYTAALDAFGRAQKVNPADPILYYNIGLAWEKSGDRQKALENFEQAR